MATQMATRETKVLMPAPVNPISGKNPTPYINIQLPSTLSTLPPRIIHIGATVFSVPKHHCSKTLNSVSGNIPASASRK